MLLGAYRLEALLGSGRDGSAYRGRCVLDDTPVEVRVLGPARARSETWPEVARRLRLAALLEHASLRAVLQIELEGEHPFVVLEPDPFPRLESVLEPGRPMAGGDVLELANQLVEALTLAHRMGLVHGRLCPAEIGWNHETRRVSIDLVGLEVNAMHESRWPELDRACRAPECRPERRLTGEADLFSLGVLIHTLIVGEVPSPQRVPFVEDLTGKELLTWSGSLRKPEPEDRPAAREALLALPHPAVPLSLERTDGPGPRELAESPEMGLPENLRVLASLSSRSAASRDTTRRSPSNKRSTAKAPVVQVQPAATRDPDLDAVSRMSCNPLPVQIGRFRLESLVGEGGLGRVYRAIDLSDGNLVAVKLLHPHLMRHAHAVRRFRKEARLLAEVRGPRIANLLEFGEENGVHYLAMEFVEGRTLADRLREGGPFPEAMAIGLVIELARALDEPHRRGIVHRDIKPENVMLVGPRETARVPCVKLLDFGLARHVLENASLELTREGAPIGSVLYMAPEQARDATRIDCRADIYALGCTLVHMLTGKPPYVGETALTVQLQHATAPVPPLRQLRLPIGEGLVQLVERCLAKSPEERFADASELLGALMRLQRGEAGSFDTHPIRPRLETQVLTYEWTFDLSATPEQLWPLVTDTDRMYQAIGCCPAAFTSRPDWRGGSQRFGEGRRFGVTQRWREYPHEWLQPRRFGVVREYSQGVFCRLVEMVTLRPTEAGTTLIHRIEIEPRGMLGRLAAGYEFGWYGRTARRRVYERMARWLASPHELADPFAEPPLLKAVARRSLEWHLHGLRERGVARHVADRLGEWLRRSSAGRVGRIRPLALARELELDADALTAALLHATREGLFLMRWEVLCPVCDDAVAVKPALRDLDERERCAACNLEFATDPAAGVELIFRLTTKIRPTESRVWSADSPARFPLVPAQIRMQPGEVLEIDLALDVGEYRVCGPQVAHSVPLRVVATALAQTVEVVLRASSSEEPAPLRPGHQRLVMVNDHPRERVIAVKRAGLRPDLLSAVVIAARPIMRELFPHETVSLATGRPTCLTWSAEDALTERLGEIARTAGGTEKAGSWAFTDALTAVRTALELRTAGAMRVAIHRGSIAPQALAVLGPGAIVSQDVIEEPRVSEWLREAGVRVELAEVETVPVGMGIPHRLV